jgi:hypothetical protein
MPELTDSDRALLAIEAKWWSAWGRKESAIREATGLSTTAAMQQVNKLIDSEAALAHDPLTVKRLRRLRAVRKRA